MSKEIRKHETTFSYKTIQNHCKDFFRKYVLIKISTLPDQRTIKARNMILIDVANVYILYIQHIYTHVSKKCLYVYLINVVYMDGRFRMSQFEYK